MHTEENKSVRNSVGRLAFVVVAVAIQVMWLVALFLRMNKYSVAINFVCEIGALVLVLRIYGKHQNSAFKMPWMILLLTFPLFGLCLYLLIGHKNVTKRMRLRFEEIDPELLEHLHQDAAVMEDLEKRDALAANQCRYISDFSQYPVYQNGKVKFFAEAVDGFEAQLAALQKAEHFIFMEYHAIEEGESFSRMKAVLAERAAHGVEVRILYDDIGSVGFIDPGFIKRMEALGIQCRMFNPVMPILNFFMNNRDHRKITVIDGKVGFTGGYNLADEYFNIVHPYGYWKDTGIQIEGEAVRSLTVMFLEMWNAMKKTDDSYEPYMVSGFPANSADGFIQLYADSPLDDEPMGENVYLNLIKTARRRLYVATPYLIISDEMERELCLAAKRGVDVRVITPGIPDKKLIYKVTRSYYAGLVRGGVRVYEYTPGFLHEKQMLCDEKTAVVGTINLDYRSLYHHFENGAFLYECGAIDDIAADFEKTLEMSEEVTEKYKEGRNAALRVTQCLLRLFAPLL